MVSNKKLRIQIRKLVIEDLINKISAYRDFLMKAVRELTKNYAKMFMLKDNVDKLISKLLADITIVARNGSLIDINQNVSNKNEAAAMLHLLKDKDAKFFVIEQLFTRYKNAPKFKVGLNVDKFSYQYKSFSKLVEVMTNYLFYKLKSKKTNTNIIKREIKSMEDEAFNSNINNRDVRKRYTETMMALLKKNPDKCFTTSKTRKMAKKLKLLADPGTKIKVYRLPKPIDVVNCIGRDEKNILWITRNSDYYKVLRKHFRENPINISHNVSGNIKQVAVNRNNTRSNRRRIAKMDRMDEDKKKKEMAKRARMSKPINILHNVSGNIKQVAVNRNNTRSNRRRIAKMDRMDEDIKKKEMAKRARMSTKREKDNFLGIDRDSFKEIVGGDEDYFKYNDGKISFTDKVKPNKKVLEVLNFVNMRGFYKIRINKKVLFKMLKIESLGNKEKIKNLIEDMVYYKNTLNSIIPQLVTCGVYFQFKTDLVVLHLPKFLFEKNNLENNMDIFFEMIKPKDINPRMHYGGIVQNIKKLFIRINRDGKGKHIFANMVDSIAKLGLMFFLPMAINDLKIPFPKVLKEVEYFTTFMIENLVTMVSPNCRVGKLKEKLFKNGTYCKPLKLLSDCPKQKPCPKVECPEANCPDPECPECSETSCPECPEAECSECPECPESECPECPKPICPKPNLTPIYGIIGSLVLVILVILFTGGKSTKVPTVVNVKK